MYSRTIFFVNKFVSTSRDKSYNGFSSFRFQFDLYIYTECVKKIDTLFLKGIRKNRKHKKISKKDKKSNNKENITTCAQQSDHRFPSAILFCMFRKYFL